MKPSLTIAAALILGGCSSVSEVVPTGKDTYMVGSNSQGGFTSDAGVKALSIRRPYEFCSSKDKLAEVKGSQSSGTQE